MKKITMKGQSLIEVLAALSIGAIITTSITVIIVSSLNNAEYGRNKNLAGKYAQEGIEVLRDIKNSNYPLFITYNGSYCLAKGQKTFGPSCSTPNVDYFIRTINIDTSVLSGCGANAEKVTATVSWSDGKCNAHTYCQNSTLVSCLTTTNQVTTP